MQSVTQKDLRIKSYKDICSDTKIDYSEYEVVSGYYVLILLYPTIIMIGRKDQKLQPSQCWYQSDYWGSAYDVKFFILLKLTILSMRLSSGGVI